MWLAGAPPTGPRTRCGPERLRYLRKPLDSSQDGGGGGERHDVGFLRAGAVPHATKGAENRRRLMRRCRGPGSDGDDDGGACWASQRPRVVSGAAAEEGGAAAAAPFSA